MKSLSEQPQARVAPQLKRLRLWEEALYLLRLLQLHGLYSVLKPVVTLALQRQVLLHPPEEHQARLSRRLYSLSLWVVLEEAVSLIRLLMLRSLHSLSLHQARPLIRLLIPSNPYQRTKLRGVKGLELLLINP